MGRGRGRGRKLTQVRRYETENGGDDGHPSLRGRRKAQNPLKEFAEEDEDRKIKAEDNADEEDSNGLKKTSPKKRSQGSESAETEKKRRRPPQTDDVTGSVASENERLGSMEIIDGSLRSNGFRQSGNRRKNTPRRAAEAGVECI
ncbi:uncharacterized protein LOC144712827 [Wolffia australiana]